MCHYAFALSSSETQATTVRIWCTQWKWVLLSLSRPNPSPWGVCVSLCVCLAETDKDCPSTPFSWHLSIKWGNGLAEIDSGGSVFAHTHINQVVDHGYGLGVILHFFCLYKPGILDMTKTVLVLIWLTCIRELEVNRSDFSPHSLAFSHTHTHIYIVMKTHMHTIYM